MSRPNRGACLLIIPSPAVGPAALAGDDCRSLLAHLAELPILHGDAAAGMRWARCWPWRSTRCWPAPGAIGE